MSKKINILGLKNIIKMYKKENNQIIYFSSPHVFSGKNPNPKTNQTIWVKERYLPKFKVSKLLIDSVNKSQLRGF